MTAPTLRPGHTVGNKYLVNRCFGNSPSVATCVAEAPDGREVVVKVIDPEVSPAVLARFERAIQRIGALDRANVAQVIDAGYDHATRAPFVVRHAVQAASVAEFVKYRRFTPAETSQLMHALAHVLNEAREQDQCHFGLKPTNAFLTNEANLVLTDFQACWLRAKTPEDMAIMTQWLAPEQVATEYMRHDVEVGHGADIYASALIAFYTLTGGSYWPLCDMDDMGAMYHQMLSCRKPASVRARELGADLSSVLDPVFARAFEPELRQRYQDARQFAFAFLNASEEDAITRPLHLTDLGLGAGVQGQGAFAPVGEQIGVQPSVQDVQQNVLSPAQQPPMDNGPDATQRRARLCAQAVVENNLPRASNRGASLAVGMASMLLIGEATAACVLMKVPREPAVEEQAVVRGIADLEFATGRANAEPEVDTGIEAKLTCEPACDTIMLDDKSIDLSASVVISPGRHIVVASKSGFVTVTEMVTMPACQAIELEFKMVPKATPLALPENSTPSAPQKVGVKQPCGKFLKRCK